MRLETASQAAVLDLSWIYCSAAGSTADSECTENNGNVLGQRIVSATMSAAQSYGYDGYSRLTGFSETLGSATIGETYGFDPWGNRWVTGRPGMPPLLGIAFAGTDYNAKNRMVLSGQTESDVYDGAGNQKRIGAMNLIFDAEGRVATATNTGNGNMEYRYDGEERRVMSLVNGAVSKLFVYDAMGQLAVEYGGVVGSGTEFLTADLLGSVRAITDSTGAVTQRRDYGPFGEELAGGDRSPGPPAEPRMKFTGKERDAETGLDYFGARFLSSVQGRFASPDAPFVDQRPSNPQTWNLYSYTRNNPLVFVDPTGRGAVSSGVKAAAHVLEKRLFNAARAEGVRRAWKQEVELVRRTGQGSREWTEAQVGELMTHGKVKGFEGHHINSVKGNDLRMAADPSNIKFVEGRAGNLAEHGGNFQNSTSGPLIDRIAKLGGAGMLAFFATFDQKMNAYSSQSPIISSPDSWWSNINPVNYLVENAALAEAFVAADAADREAKKREEEEHKKRGGN